MDKVFNWRFIMSNLNNTQNESVNNAVETVQAELVVEQVVEPKIKTETISTVVNGVEVKFDLNIPVVKEKVKVEKPVKEKVNIKLNNGQVGAALQVIDLIIKQLGFEMSTEGDFTQFRTDDASFKNRLKKINKFKKLIEYKASTGLELSEDTIDTTGFEIYQMSSKPEFTIISFGDNTMVLSDHFTHGEAASNVIYFGEVFVNGAVDKDFVESVRQYLTMLNRRTIPGDYAWKKSTK